MQMVINALPTEAAFGARVTSLNTRVQALSTARGDVADLITTATTDYNTKNGLVNDANTAKTDLDAALVAIESSVALNESSLANIDTRLSAVDTAILSLAPVSDSFYTNASQIDWIANSTIVPDSTKCVAAGQTVQFYLSMTSDSTDGGEVLDVILLADNVAVAQSTVEKNLGDAAEGRSFGLFYEATVGAQTEFKVQVVADLDDIVGTPATKTLANNLMYGYKVLSTSNLVTGTSGPKTSC